MAVENQKASVIIGAELHDAGATAGFKKLADTVANLEKRLEGTGKAGKAAGQNITNTASGLAGLFGGIDGKILGLVNRMGPYALGVAAVTKQLQELEAAGQKALAQQGRYERTFLRMDDMGGIPGSKAAIIGALNSRLGRDPENVHALFETMAGRLGSPSQRGALQGGFANVARMAVGMDTGTASLIADISSMFLDADPTMDPKEAVALATKAVKMNRAEANMFVSRFGIRTLRQISMGTMKPTDAIKTVVAMQMAAYEVKDRAAVDQMFDVIEKSGDMVSVPGKSGLKVQKSPRLAMLVAQNGPVAAVLAVMSDESLWKELIASATPDQARQFEAIKKYWNQSTQAVAGVSENPEAVFRQQQNVSYLAGASSLRRKEQAEAELAAERRRRGVGAAQAEEEAKHAELVTKLYNGGMPEWFARLSSYIPFQTARLSRTFGASGAVGGGIQEVPAELNQRLGIMSKRTLAQIALPMLTGPNLLYSLFSGKDADLKATLALAETRDRQSRRAILARARQGQRDGIAPPEPTQSTYRLPAPTLSGALAAASPIDLRIHLSTPPDIQAEVIP